MALKLISAVVDVTEMSWATKVPPVLDAGVKLLNVPDDVRLIVPMVSLGFTAATVPATAREALGMLMVNVLPFPADDVLSITEPAQISVILTSVPPKTLKAGVSIMAVIEPDVARFAAVLATTVAPGAVTTEVALGKVPL